jgi:plasmid stabilization system protein ParE
VKRRRVRWSDEALSNLREILAFIREDSARRAEHFGERVIAATSRLSRFPRSGRSVPELQDQTPPPREIIVGDYRIIYQEMADGVEIVLMIHGRRQLPVTRRSL